MMNMKKEIKPYVTIPRYIASDFRGGKLTPRELSLYLWIRINANPYGISIVSLPELMEEPFKGKSENSINKLLLSLRRKRYIDYKSRQGRRGSFEVHFGDWLLPDRKIKQLDNSHGHSDVRDLASTDAVQGAEVAQSPPTQSPKLEHMKSQLVNNFSNNQQTSEVRSSYNDTDNEKNNYSFDKTFKGIEVGNFEPKNKEEEICWRIAKKLEEKNMDYILSKMNKHGIELIRSATILYSQVLKNGKTKIMNPPAYFNKLVEKLIVSGDRFESFDDVGIQKHLKNS